MKISNILATKGNNVVTIYHHQTVKEAANLLTSHKIGALVVVDEAQAGKLVGILSERDIIRETAQKDIILTLPVDMVMTKNVTTGSPHDDLKSVLQTMTDQRFRHLPIIDQGKLVGIISLGDVVKALLDKYEGEVHTLEIQILEG